MLSLTEIVSEVKERMADNLHAPISGFGIVKSVLQSTALPLTKSIAAGELAHSGFQALRGSGLQSLLSSARLTVPALAPSIQPLNDVKMIAGSAQDLAVVISDPDGLDRLMQLSVVSSNNLIIPANAVSFTGVGGNRTLDFVTTTAGSGLVTLTLTVTDSQGLSASTSVDINVLPRVPYNAPLMVDRFSSSVISEEETLDDPLQSLSEEDTLPISDEGGVFVYISEAAASPAQASLQSALRPQPIQAGF